MLVILADEDNRCASNGPLSPVSGWPSRPNRRRPALAAGTGWRARGVSLSVSGGARRDGFNSVGGIHGDLPWFGRLQFRDEQPQHPVLVAGLDVPGVETVTQKQLAGEGSLRMFAHQGLGPLTAPVTLGLDGEHVLLHRQVDR